MSEYRPTLERELQRLSPPRIPFDELARRRDVRQRNQRIEGGGRRCGDRDRDRGARHPHDRHRSAADRYADADPAARTDRHVRAGCRVVSVFTTDPYSDHQQLVAVDPTEPQRTVTLAPIEGGQYANPIAWSSDGARLLLLRDQHGGRDLSVLSADGSETMLQRGFVFGASFSPDGSEVVYGSGGDLFVVDADGGTPRRLVKGGGGLLATPAWSPDGARIAFVDHGEEGAAGTAGIFVVDPDGSHRQMLVDGRDLDEDASWGLSWSPDGTRLAFAVGTGSSGGPRGAIYLVDADGSGLQEVPGPGETSWPVWSPDGSRLAFVCRSLGDTDANLCVMPLADGVVTRFDDVSFVMDDSLRTVAWNPVTGG